MPAKHNYISSSFIRLSSKVIFKTTTTIIIFHCYCYRTFPRLTGGLYNVLSMPQVPAGFKWFLYSFQLTNNSLHFFFLQQSEQIRVHSKRFGIFFTLPVHKINAATVNSTKFLFFTLHCTGDNFKIRNWLWVFNSQLCCIFKNTCTKPLALVWS